MPDQGRGFDDWLTEKDFGGNFNRLGKWRDDGHVVIWIHTNTKMYKRLVHKINFVEMKQNEKTGKDEPHMGFMYFICHEEVADYQKRRTSGFPLACPLDRFIDWLECNSSIPDDAIVWRAEIGDRKIDKICTKADFVGDRQGGGDWRLSFKPTLETVVAVIDDDNVDNGIVVAAEKFSLIEKMKKAVVRAMDSAESPELGNPAINPYAFKWTFDKNATKAENFYDAYPYPKAKLTDEIAALLETEAVDLSGWVQPGDSTKLREIMEEHCVLEDKNGESLGIEIPFDMFFDNVRDEPRERDERQTTQRTREPSEPKTERRQRQARDPEPSPGMEPCPMCNGSGRFRSRACNGCGGSGEIPVEPPPEESGPAMEPCPMCGGSGKFRGKTCQGCGGSGKIEAAPEEEQVEEKQEEPPPETTRRVRRTREPVQEEKPETPQYSDDELTDECGVCGRPMHPEATKCPNPACNAVYA